MHIVLVDHYAGGPSLGMEFRPYYFAREWMKKGHKVIIVAGTYSHVRNIQPSIEKSGSINTIDGVDFLWLKTNRYKGNGLGRTWSMLLFTWKLNWGLRKYLKKFKPNLLIASSTYPLENFAIHRLSKRFRCKYCYEVHDLWPLSPMELGGFSKYHPFIMLMQWAENYAYRNADFIISLLPAAKAHMVSHGLTPDKFFYIPNGVVTSEWSDSEPLAEDLLKSIQFIKASAKFTIAYAGTHGLANSLGSLLDAAKLLKKEATIVLIGDGLEKAILQRKVTKENISNVYFLPPVRKNLVPTLLNYFDACYIGLMRQSLFRFGISPNKMFDYMMAGKPIVQAIEAGNNMVEEYGCGISVEPENAQSIASGISYLMSLNESERKQMGANGKRAIYEFHDYKVLSENFILAANGKQEEK